MYFNNFLAAGIECTMRLKEMRTGKTKIVH